MDFHKVVTPKAFDLVIFDHRQVGEAGKNDAHPKWLDSIQDNSVLNAFISGGPRILGPKKISSKYVDISI